MMFGKAEGTIEIPNRDVLDIPANWESERPLSGMEQPFSNELSSDEQLFGKYKFPDSDRPGECFPEIDTMDFEKCRSSVDAGGTDDYDDIGAGISDIGGNQSDFENRRDGLTDEQKKGLKERTNWPDEIIDPIGSTKEAEIYEKAGLKGVQIDGKYRLIRESIDLDLRDDDGITNRERMERGRPPFTKDGEEIELHHVGQKQNSPLAELTMEEHRGTGNDTILHDKTKESEIDRNAFAKERKGHWKSRLENMEGA